MSNSRMLEDGPAVGAAGTASGQNSPASRSDVGKRKRWLGPVAFGLLALACLFLVDRVGAAALRWILLLSDDRTARIYAGGRNDDVLILGGSVGNAMVLSTELSAATGQRAFTIAIHGLDAVTQDALVGDYLAGSAHPRLALMDMRPARTKLVRAPEFKLYARDGNRIEALNAQRPDTLLPWTSIFHIHRINTPLFPVILQRIVDRNDQVKGVSNGKINPEIIKAWLRGSKSEVAVPEQVHAFVATVEAFIAAGTRPILIMPPLHPTARFQARDGVEEVSSLVPGGVVLCDFADLLNEDRYFEDPAHLNEEGRQAFLPFLAALVTAGPVGASGGQPRDGIAAPQKANKAVEDRVTQSCRTVASRKGK